MTEKLALITGAGRATGLGFAVGRQLAEQGCHVLLAAREPAAAEDLAARLRADGLSADAVALDLTDTGSITGCAAAVQRHGRLDALINNAAGGFDIEQSVLDADLDIARLAMEVNVLGPWRLAQCLLPLLRDAPAGRIVNVSSAAGSRPGLASREIGGLVPAYSISKSALNAFTVKLATALAGTRIKVNAVCPGETATHPETGDEDGGRPAEVSARGVVWAATLGADGPSGGFFRDGEPIPW